VYLLSQGTVPYLEFLDVAFSFELFHSAWEPAAVRGALEASLALGDGRAAWVLSNHDFPRLPDRVGERNVRAAAMLLLTLPGATFVYQGDELGLADGPGRGTAAPPDDRHGRDRHRHPMPWDGDAPNAGFTTGAPWLPVGDATGTSVAAQERDPHSLLHLYRDLVAARRELSGPLQLLPADATAPGVLAYHRGDRLIALNLGASVAAAPPAGAVLRHTHEPDRRGAPRTLAPGEGFVAHRR
jgi:alpha-glucosidase